MIMMQQQDEDNNGGVGGVYVKVMTDEQLEILRKQIAAYVTICEQLVDMHKSLTSHPHLPGAGLGNLYCDPLVTNVGLGNKMGRQRWTPTPVQLQILESIFDQGIGTPSKQKIKEITSELSKHGQILETNVYNWFQNRRARSKRKQQVATLNNGESEVETEVESSNDKKTKSDDMCFQNPVICGKASRSLGHVLFYDSMASSPRIDHLLGKMEDSGSYNTYMHSEDFDLS